MPLTLSSLDQPQVWRRYRLVSQPHLYVPHYGVVPLAYWKLTGLFQACGYPRSQVEYKEGDS